MLYEVITHAAGANVVIHYYSSDAEATALVDELNASRAGSALAVCGDLKDTQIIEPLIRITSYNVCYTKLLRGDVVVAIVDGEEATLKRYYREGNRVRLQPANATMDPIYPESLEIRGIVEGVIRRF